jgi:TadE-like protein
MHRLRGFKRARKGAVLVEFALSALLFVVVLMATLEFGLETHARNTTERVANRATEAYASTRDMSVVDAVIADRTDAVLSRCLQPVRVVLFDSIAGIDPLRDAGRPVNVGDPSTAVAFRLELVCIWPRLTPAFGGLLGSPDGYTSTGFARLRVGGAP